MKFSPNLRLHRIDSFVFIFATPDSSRVAPARRPGGTLAPPRPRPSPDLSSSPPGKARSASAAAGSLLPRLAGSGAGGSRWWLAARWRRGAPARAWGDGNFPWCAWESARGARRRPSASGGGRWALGGAPACAGGGGPCARSAAPSLTRTARGMAAARRGRRSGCGGAGGSLICRYSRVCLVVLVVTAARARELDPFELIWVKTCLRRLLRPAVAALSASFPS